MSTYGEKVLTPEQQEISELALEEVLSALEMKDIMADGMKITPHDVGYRLELRIIADISRSQAHRIIWGEEQ